MTCWNEPPMADNLDVYMCMTSSANTEAAELLLQEGGIPYKSFISLPSLIAEAKENGLGVLFLEEAQLRQYHDSLQTFLAAQPHWSEPPVILVIDRMYTAIGRILVEQIPHLTMLERPVSSASLLSHLRAAQQGRKRQYQLRDLLSKLSQLNVNLEEQVASRTAEAERRRIEAERSNADLQQFASVVSHDLREPLLVITRYLNLLDKRCGEALDDTGRRFVRQSIAGAQRMQNMVSSILKYSRSESAILNLESVAVGRLVDQVCTTLELRIKEARAIITKDENMPTVYGDRVQLGRLFQNLFSNGIKFTHMEPPRIHISAEKEEGEYHFSVADNGIGINSEHYQKIFKIFDRADTREKYPGSGIGLAVCKKIVERHGGTIWVESKMWQGSTFHFTLPADMQGLDSKPKPPA